MNGLTKDNFLETRKGSISIKDVKEGDEVLTIFGTKKVWTKVLDFNLLDKAKIIKLTTNNGDVLTLAEGQKILTCKGWKTADEISIGEFIISTEYNSIITSKTKFEEKQEVYEIITNEETYLANNILIYG